MQRYFVTYVEAEKVMHALEWFGCMPEREKDFPTLPRLGLAFSVGEDGEILPDHVIVRSNETQGSAWTAQITQEVADSVLNEEDYARMRAEAHRWQRRTTMLDIVDMLARRLGGECEQQQGGEAA